jgi:hypothetical protein
MKKADFLSPMTTSTCLHLQVEHLEVPEAAELRKLRLLKGELGELAQAGGMIRK